MKKKLEKDIKEKSAKEGERHNRKKKNARIKKKFHDKMESK